MRLIGLLYILSCTLLLVGCKTTHPQDAYLHLSDRQIYAHATAHMHKKRYEQAARDLQALGALYPFGDYAQSGQFTLITALYRSGQHDSALAAADRYIRLYPRADNVDYAYYMKGVINAGAPRNRLMRFLSAPPAMRDISSQKQAAADFSIFLQKFPGSKYAKDAQKRLQILIGMLAQHELDIATYYFKRKAFVAAANRASELVAQYPKTKQARTGLAIMVHSYQALGETQMANRAQQGLKTGYPTL